MDGPGLKAWRLAAGLTLPAAAKVLGISRATMARHEAGAEVPAKIVERIEAPPGPPLSSDSIGQLLDVPEGVTENRVVAITLAQMRTALEAAGLHVLTGAEFQEAMKPVSLAEMRADLEAAGFVVKAETEAEPPKLTPAEARAILEAQGFRVTTAAEMERLLAPAAAGVRVTVTRPVLTNPKGHHPATLTGANVPERKPGKGAVFVPTERTAGMSKNATVRPALKARRVIGFAPDGSEVWG